MEEDSTKQQKLILILFMLQYCAITSHKQATVFGAGLFQFNGNVYH